MFDSALSFEARGVIVLVLFALVFWLFAAVADDDDDRDGGGGV